MGDLKVAAPRRAKGEHGATGRVSGPPPALVEKVDDAAEPLSAPQRSYAECYTHFVAEARAIPAAEVQPYPGDARLVLVNVRTGLEAVCADPALVARHMPLMPVARAVEAADVARALVHIDGVAQRKVVSPRVWNDTLKRVTTRRRALVSALHTLVDMGRLQPGDIEGLGGRGGLDPVLNDATLAVSIMRTHADAIRGMHPFSDDDLASIQRDADWLRENTRPKGARRSAKRVSGTPDDDRDRLWTLLTRRHALVMRIGGYFHGAEVTKVVPSLRSRVTVARPTPDGEDDTPQPAKPA